MNETLQDYGYNFQVKVLSSLMTDRNFVNHIYDILLPSYFDSKALRWICEHTLLYFKEYKKLPSLEVFKVQVNSVKIDLDKKEIVHSLKDVWKQIESDDLQFVKETILEFSKNQELKRAILKSVDLLNSGKFDEIKREIDNALKKGMNESLGHDYLTEVEQRYVENAQGLRISTGWDVIDNITGGGIPAGKLCVWIAGPGGSKSFHLVHLGGTALKLGKTVLHYTLELDENYVAQRYDAFFTGIELDDLKFHVKEIDKRLEKYRTDGKLTIKFFPTKGISLQGLKAHIEKTIMLDKKPDIIILDYADLLKLGTNQNMRKDELLQELYEELRGLAGELNIPIHTASQINRCLKFDSKVDIEGKGMIDIKDVKENDFILTHEGYKRVIETYTPTKQAVYRIKLKNGQTIECSSKHEFPTLYGQLKSIENGLNIGDKLFIKK